MVASGNDTNTCSLSVRTEPYVARQKCRRAILHLRQSHRRGGDPVMSTITGTRIDQVLQDAVESGAVPNVVAMAADAHGPIYAGAAGPRAVGESDPVTPDTMFRIASMTKMVATTAALQLAEQGKLELDAPVETYRPEFARAAGARGLRRRHAAAAPAGQQGHGAAADHAHVRARVLVLQRGRSCAGRRRPGRPTSSPARRSSSRRRWSRTRARATSTGSTRTGWAGWSRPRAARRWTTTSPSTSSARWAWSTRRS